MGLADELLKGVGDQRTHEQAMQDMAPVLMDLATVCAGRPTPAVLSAACNFLVVVALEQMERGSQGLIVGVTDQATRAFLNSVGHELIALSQKRGNIPLDARLVAARDMLRRPWPPVRS